MEEHKIEKLDMSKKPKEEIAVFGLGILFNKLDDIILILNKINSTMMHLENKVEALMDESAQRRHEEIKRRFSR